MSKLKKVNGRLYERYNNGGQPFVIRRYSTYGKDKTYTQEPKQTGRRLTDGQWYVAYNRQVWNGFHLIRGHVYGMTNGVLYVSAAEPDKCNPNYIMVYKQCSTPDRMYWAKRSIPVSGDLAQAIIQAVRSSPFQKVDFPEPRVNCSRSKPTFPTFRARRADTDPQPPKPPRPLTWVDQICAEVMA